MRFLTFSLFLLLLGCASYPKKIGYTTTEIVSQKIVNPYFSDKKKDYVYKSNITVFKNTFGGILVLKKMDDETHRIAFTTELGNTIFDFSISETEFKVNRILKELDRKILLSVLEQDFRSLVQEKTSPLETFEKGENILNKVKIGSKIQYYTFKNDTLTNITRVGNQREKVDIAFFEIGNTMARHIQISHKNLKLAISLRAIK
ncbi:hypothetical protein [Maribacter sp. 4G9]|uniref:hypothetical protein n=1 Tax=Maribacter sp. 4G9 TaxID=1889777 RepID=UPI000C14BC33|nr:hypothetical protein [Maribacter sp. 4G9]PIB37863.1 hypothetical protein BFP75_18930 [Maribacter sp. 4G9]